jgi:hypothetical protein
MKSLILICLMFLVSCNVVKGIFGGDTDLDQDFFDTNHCDDVCRGLRNDLISYYGFNGFVPGYNDFQGAHFLTALSGLGYPGVSGYRGGGINCGAMTITQHLSNATFNGFNGNGQDFSISLWINRQSQSSPVGNAIFMDDSTYTIKIEQDLSSDNLTVNVGGLTQGYPGFFSSGGWRHLVVRVERLVGISLCVDGVCGAYDGNATNGQSYGAFDLRICSDTTTASMNAHVDSVGFWSKLLTDQEVGALAIGNTDLD